MTSLRKLRHIAVIWALLEILCFGGLESGWGSLIYILKDEGILSEMCPAIASVLPNDSNPVNETRTNNSANSSSKSDVTECAERDVRFNLYYTTGTGCAMIFHLIGGQLFSRFGTRVVRCLYICIFWTGCLMIAFTSPEHPWLICTGLLFQTGGSLVFLMTTAQLGNLYQKGAFIVIGLANGVMDSSSIIQLLIKLAHTAGFKRRYSYILLVVASLISVVSTFLIFPRSYVFKRRELKVSRRSVHGMVKESDSVQSSSEIHQESVFSFHFRKNVINPIFIPHILWFGIMMLHFNFYIATINTYLNYVTNENDQQVSYFTNVLSYTMFCGIISSLAAGYIYESQKQRYKDSKVLIHRKIMPAIVPMMVAAMLGLSLSVLMMIPGTNVLYVAFINFTVFRSFLFCVAMAFLSDAFPTKTFGVLYTIMMAVAIGSRWVQYGVFVWWKSYDGGMTHTHVFLLLLSVVTFLHPTVLLWQCKRLMGKNSVSATRYFPSILEEASPKESEELETNKTISTIYNI